MFGHYITDGIHKCDEHMFKSITEVSICGNDKHWLTGSKVTDMAGNGLRTSSSSYLLYSFTLLVLVVSSDVLGESYDTALILWPYACCLLFPPQCNSQ